MNMRTISSDLIFLSLRCSRVTFHSKDPYFCTLVWIEGSTFDKYYGLEKDRMMIEIRCVSKQDSRSIFCLNFTFVSMNINKEHTEINEQQVL